MRTIKLIIEYDGTNFNGWQIQDKGKRTIQDELEKACLKVFKKSVRVIGSGRTDSGVHAASQVAHFKIDSHLDITLVARAINASLPSDIAVIKAEDAPQNFHAQYSAKGKIYRYTILNRKTREALSPNLSYFYPVPLNLTRMRQEAKMLLGRKDFKSFQATPSDDMKHKSTIRTIKNLAIKRNGDYIYIDIEANGFLHKMVRNIVGTLLDIGTGRLPRGSIKKILAKKNRLAAGKTAKAKGLCLLKVKY